jgi:tetratricopeptide (TPR) repeat protein
MKRILFLLLLHFGLCFCHAQNDSLFRSLDRAKDAASRYKALMALGNYFQAENPDSAANFHALAIAEAVKCNKPADKGAAQNECGWDHYLMSDFEGAAKIYLDALETSRQLKARDSAAAMKLYTSACVNIGSAYTGLGKSGEALDYYGKALAAHQRSNNRLGQATVLGNMGIVYKNLGNYPEALKKYFAALKVTEEAGEKEMMAMTYSNIGNVFLVQGDEVKSLAYFEKSAMLNKTLGNTRGLALSYGNIARVYGQLGENDKALSFYNEALKLHVSLGDKSGIALNYTNIGLLMFHVKKFDDALKYFLEAEKLYQETGNKPNEVANITDMGVLYSKTGKYSDAEKCLKRALQLGAELRSHEDLRIVNQNLSELYEITGRPALALSHYKLFVQYQDSISNDEATRQSIQQEFKFNYERKFAADSVAFAKEKQLGEAEIARQKAEIRARRNQQYATIGGLMLLIVFAGFMYNRFQVTKKQKEIIESQKKTVEEKQKEILDSIQYAKRIQSSLLTPEKYVERNFERLKLEKRQGKEF